MTDFTSIPQVSPFPVKHLGRNVYQAKLDDLSNYVNTWSNGDISYADARYASNWLYRIGVPCVQSTVKCYLPDKEDAEYLVEWHKNRKDFVHIPYENAWKDR